MDETPGAILNRFHISLKYGFMLEDPLDCLPDYFSPWDKLAKNCASLITAKKLRDEVNKLEALSTDKLRGYRQHRLAYMYLSFLANGYVWQEGDQGVSQILPKQLSIPLCHLANVLGSKPAMGHSAFCLSNWKVIDETKPAQLGNLRTICQFPGGAEYDWFTLVTAAVELACVPALTAIVDTIQAVTERNNERLLSDLEIICETLINMKNTLSRMHENLSAPGFFNVFRPFLSGWGESGSPLPDGLVYEGVSDVPQKVIGGSAAQSSTISCFDAVFGIQHEADKQEFLNTMLEYMPRDHREFVLYLRKTCALRNYVQSQKSTELRGAYDDCVNALKEFRSYHINLVTKYIVVQSRNESRNKDFEGVAQKGTGGTPLIPFLQSLRDTTTPN